MNFIKRNIFICCLFSVFGIGCVDDDPKPFKQNVSLTIEHVWNDSVLHLNKAYFWDHDFITDTIITTTLTYHINNLSLLTSDDQRIPANLQYYMIDLESKKVLPEAIKFTSPKEGVNYYVKALEFTIGIADSLTNKLGMLNSSFIAPMYWGMVQGYINFKYEALSPQAKNSALLYHIGGYTKPYSNARTVTLTFDKPYYLNQNNSVLLSANLFKLFNSVNFIDIRQIDLIHSPNANSKLIADNMASMFKFLSFK